MKKVYIVETTWDSGECFESVINGVFNNIDGAQSLLDKISSEYILIRSKAPPHIAALETDEESQLSLDEYIEWSEPIENAYYIYEARYPEAMNWDETKIVEYEVNVNMGY